METYLIKLQYQGDERCEDCYKAYMETTDEEKVETAVIMLPEFFDLEENCILNYEEEDDEEWDRYAEVYAENISNDDSIIESNWFKSLVTLIDERENGNN